MKHASDLTCAVKLLLLMCKAVRCLLALRSRPTAALPAGSPHQANNSTAGHHHTRKLCQVRHVGTPVLALLAYSAICNLPSRACHANLNVPAKCSA